MDLIAKALFNEHTHIYCVGMPRGLQVLGFKYRLCGQRFLISVCMYSFAHDTPYYVYKNKLIKTKTQFVSEIHTDMTWKALLFTVLICQTRAQTAGECVCISGSSVNIRDSRMYIIYKTLVICHLFI